MREVQVTLPELALLVGTRAALGAGLGLLLADCLPGSHARPSGGRSSWSAPSPPSRSRSRCSARSAPRPRPECRRDRRDKTFRSDADRNVPRGRLQGRPSGSESAEDLSHAFGPRAFKTLQEIDS